MKQLTYILLSVCMTLAPQLSSGGNIQSTLQHPNRDVSNQLRDQYRHPAETLSFFGVRADMAIIEIWPGKGWYTEVLAPWFKQGDGHFIAAGFPKNAGPEWRQNMQAEYEVWLNKYPDRFDRVNVVEFGPPDDWQLGPENSVDAVLTFRNVHNWVKGGYADTVFTAMFDVLKPGGLLGLTDHRANPGTDIGTMNASGYLTEQFVITLAQKAGFILEEKSEINSNPNDTKDYPAGVWTLPPTLRLGDQDKNKYMAIGESDRMTLRFRKPQD